ncbi:hypothetical protein [Thiohalomonas denitrificans]|uniref:hypothetical protein n=1 Tax=Thiohalomonas denitrificans TaxID=415747 RepID=UPI0026F08D64|nr:hypothetical protein [Thiohalomonas denitrificans]
MSGQDNAGRPLQMFNDAAFLWALLPASRRWHAPDIGIDVWCELGSIGMVWRRAERQGWCLTSARGLSSPHSRLVSALLCFERVSQGMPRYLDLHCGDLRWACVRYFPAPDSVADITTDGPLPRLRGAALLATQSTHCALRGDLLGERLQHARDTWNNLSRPERKRWRQATEALVGSDCTGSVESLLEGRSHRIPPVLILRSMAFLRQYVVRQPLRCHLLRWAALVRRPCSRQTGDGLVVSFIGPDGSGKSTLLSRVEAALAEAGESIRSEYWGRSRGQSGWVKAVRRHALQRHGGSARSDAAKVAVPGSALKVQWKGRLVGNLGAFVYLVDYWRRWLTGVVPRRGRDRTLLLDRGPADLKSMSRASPWARNLWRWAPQVDLVVNCQASPNAIFARKGERTPEELAADLQDYHQVVLQLRAREQLAIEIDTSQPIPVCVEQVRQALGLARMCKGGGVDPAVFFALVKT